jgi:hypothetical protein
MVVKEEDGHKKDDKGDGDVRKTSTSTRNPNSPLLFRDLEENSSIAPNDSSERAPSLNVAVSSRVNDKVRSATPLLQAKKEEGRSKERRQMLEMKSILLSHQAASSTTGTSSLSPGAVPVQGIVPPLEIHLTHNKACP